MARYIKIKTCLNCRHLMGGKIFTNNMHCTYNRNTFKSVLIDKKKFIIPENCPLPVYGVPEKNNNLWHIVQIVLSLTLFALALLTAVIT